MLPVLSILVLYPALTLCQQYSDLVALTANCTTRDYCGRNSPDFSERNCECDSLCTNFGDCCLNKPRPTARPVTSRFHCRPDSIGSGTGVYVVDTCPRNYVGPAVLRNKCEHEEDVKDPVLAAFVTDSSNGITYRNRYCSECNGAAPPNLQSWQISVKCDFTSNVEVNQSTFWRNLVYRDPRWVYVYNGEETPCSLVYQKPSYVQSPTRQCRANVVSECPPSWRREPVRRACASYMAVVYTPDDIAFRNPHCAICNRRPLNTLACARTGLTHRGRKPFSFAMLLDVNRTDGEIVGERAVNRCPPKHKFDPFFDKCRKVSCVLPGYAMVGDKCVKKQ